MEDLDKEVCKAYACQGRHHGSNRFDSWSKRLCDYLDNSLPGEAGIFMRQMKNVLYSSRLDDTPLKQFWRIRGEKAQAFIESLIHDLKKGHYTPPAIGNSAERAELTACTHGAIKNVFIVHGHDKALQQEVARFVEKLGLESIILQEQTSGGKTIIEMIEAQTDVSFAIVLYTPDDVGASEREAKEGRWQPRARQNVVFEHGYLMARLSRQRVAYLVSDEKIALPTDIGGMLYAREDWMLRIAREMKRFDPSIDLNRLG